MSRVVTLIHQSERFSISARLLIVKCDLFLDDPTLIAFPYNVKSQVSFAVFREFVSALEGTTITIRNSNFSALSQLCDEFGFRELAEELGQFRDSEKFKKQMTTEDSEARMRLSILEERIQQRDKEVAMLQDGLLRQSQLM
jgi:hypothetical protein